MSVGSGMKTTQRRQRCWRRARAKCYIEADRALNIIIRVYTYIYIYIERVREWDSLGGHKNRVELSARERNRVGCMRGRSMRHRRGWGGEVLSDWHLISGRMTAASGSIRRPWGQSVQEAATPLAPTFLFLRRCRCITLPLSSRWFLLWPLHIPFYFSSFSLYIYMYIHLAFSSIIFIFLFNFVLCEKRCTLICNYFLEGKFIFYYLFFYYFL